MLGEAKKRKISIRGEDLLLWLLAKAEDLTVAAGEVTTEAREEPVAMSKGAKEGTVTFREGDFSI